MGIKLKATVLLCLVSLLVVLPAIGACAPKEKPLADLTVKVDWVEPVAVAVKPYEIPKSLGSEYATFHVILSVTNPNDYLVTVESIEVEIFANDISMGAYPNDGPVYLPAGKEALVRFPITLNSLLMIKEVVMQKHVSIPDGVKILLGAWKAIQDGTASYQVKGGAHVVTDTTSRYQKFDLRWP